MGKKGFLLIDGCKNCVILNPDELKEADLYDIIMKKWNQGKVRQNKDLKELDKSVRKYLKGGWSDECE